MSQYTKVLNYQKTDGTTGSCYLYTTTSEVPNSYFQAYVDGQNVYAALVDLSHNLASSVRVYRNADGKTYAIAKYTPYVVGQTIFESSTGGASGTLNIETEGYYRVIAVGGGGGGCLAYVKLQVYIAKGASGGSGAAYDVVFYLSSGNYTYSVGTGGTNFLNTSKTTGVAGDGGNTIFGENYAYGGKGGNITSSSVAGQGGDAPYLAYTTSKVYTNSAGNTGTTYTNVPAGTFSTGNTASPYGNHGYGGGFSGGDGSAVANSGGSGYLKVEFVSY